MSDVVEERAEWTAAYINDLPDSAFACILSGGEKDESGKTVPRSLRKYPHHDASGAVDAAHLANARARVRQSGTETCGVEHLFETHSLPSDEDGDRAEPLADVEIRSAEMPFEFRADNDSLTFNGYAAVWNQPSRPLPFIETFAPGAFSRSLRTRTNIRLLVDHNPERLLASRQARTLRLAEDDNGLRVDADLAPTSYGRDLKVLADRGEIRSMSFAFKPTKDGEQWSPDGQARTVTEARLFEVSILTGHDAAYETTSAFIRALSHQLGESEDELAAAVLALAEGQQLDAGQHRLLMEAINDLRPEPPAVPVAVFQRRLTLNAKRPF